MTDVAALQQEIEQERRRRGFTTDPVRLLVLLTEEVGEVARELKGSWSPNYPDVDPAAVGKELADVAVLVCALATSLGVDLETAIREKFFLADASRDWRTASET